MNDDRQRAWDQFAAAALAGIKAHWWYGLRFNSYEATEAAAQYATDMMALRDSAIDEAFSGQHTDQRPGEERAEHLEREVDR